VGAVRKTQTQTQRKEHMKVSITRKITLQKIATLLCSAFEGGSNYWYEIEDYVSPEKITFQTEVDRVFPHIDYPLNAGGAVMVKDLENYDEPAVKLDLEKIEKGLKIMIRKYPSHMDNFINENDDGETGDVFLQCCLFGEVKYG
jgi:hypothetical protein